jgi:hypothetical protein
MAEEEKEVENDLKTKAEFKKTFCPGCRDNFYNGNNNMGITDCWMLVSAKKAMKKKVWRDDVPPWNHTPIETLTCFRAEGYWMVDPDRTN